MIYGFNDRNVAEQLKRMANGQTTPMGMDTPTTGLMYQTPSGGIPARSGTTLGQAACTPYWVVVDPDTGVCTLERMLKPDGTNIDDTIIYNLSETAVGGSSYIVAFEIWNIPVAVWEDCA